MLLRVTDKERELMLGEIRLTVEEFINIRNHPSLANAQIDTAVIDLDDRVPSDVLKAMLGKVRIIPVLPEEISAKIVQHLVVLYPERAPILRHKYFMNKGELATEIESLRKAYDWDSFY